MSSYFSFIMECERSGIGKSFLWLAPTPFTFPSKSLRLTQVARTSPNRLIDIARYPCYHILVIQSFKDSGTEDIFNGNNTKDARNLCPATLWKVAARKLDQLDSITKLQELRIPPGNQLEALSGNRKEIDSIRINDQYRICFKWTDLGPEQVEIVDYH